MSHRCSGSEPAPALGVIGRDEQRQCGGLLLSGERPWWVWYGGRGTVVKRCHWIEVVGDSASGAGLPAEHWGDFDMNPLHGNITNGTLHHIRSHGLVTRPTEGMAH